MLTGQVFPCLVDYYFVVIVRKGLSINYTKINMKYSFIALLLLASNTMYTQTNSVGVINSYSAKSGTTGSRITVCYNTGKATEANKFESLSPNKTLLQSPKPDSRKNLSITSTPLWIKHLNEKLVSLDNEIEKLKSPSINTLVSAYNRQGITQIDSIEAAFQLLPHQTNGFKQAYPFLARQGNKQARQLSKAIKTDDLPDFWSTLYSVESKQGARLYRPRNKAKSCAYTKAPCGHHQLSLQALKDIGCNSLQCRKDRENYAKSLAMSQRLQAINQKRLEKKGIKGTLPEYQRYLIHQQGAYGLKKIIAARDGKQTLSKAIFRHMANNSTYSFRSLKKMGSKLAAEKFLQHWKNKWDNEKELIMITRQELGDLPVFTDNELQIALNLKIRY